MDYSYVAPRWDWNKGEDEKRMRDGKILATKRRDGGANDTHHTTN